MSSIQKIWRLLTNPISVGVMTFLTIMIVGHTMLGPTVCNDGWHSPSIGTQGACSHHGGVNRTPGTLLFFTSLALSLVSGFVRQGQLNKKVEINDQIALVEFEAWAAQNGRTCQRCGNAMKTALEPDYRTRLSKSKYYLRCSNLSCPAVSRRK